MKDRKLLRHRVEIQTLTVVYDEMGAPSKEWVTVGAAWAAVEPVSGREYWAAAAVQAETTVKVTMRYLPGITPYHRLLFKGKLYDIQSVINTEERNRELVLMCTAKEGK
jgi:SPP1 family predicted phage head-tail adaptor